MAFKYINGGSGGINNSVGTLMTGPFLSQTKDLNTSMADGNVAAFSGMEKYYRGSFNTGTGIMIGQGGVVLYDANTAGSGVLEQLLIVNRGNSTLYFGINSETMDVARGTPLASGESLQIQDDAIRSLWAITQSGNSSIVTAQGVYRYNDNAV